MRHVLACSLSLSLTSTHGLTVLTALMIKAGGQEGHSSKWPWILFLFYPNPSVGSELVGFQLYCFLPIWRTFVTWYHGERAFLRPSWLSGEAWRNAFPERKSCLSVSSCCHFHYMSNVVTYLEVESGITCESVTEREQQRCSRTLWGLNSAKWPAIEWSSLFMDWLWAAQQRGDES